MAFEDESADEAVVYGTRKPLNSWDPVWANLQVYEGLLFDARHTARWQDKLRYLLLAPGWHHAGPDKRARTLRLQAGIEL